MQRHKTARNMSFFVRLEIWCCDCLRATRILYKNILGNIILSECDTANKSHNGVVKFRRYYLGKTRLFYIHLRGFPPRPIYVSGHKTNADKCGNKMNIRFICTFTESVFVLAAQQGARAERGAGRGRGHLPSGAAGAACSIRIHVNLWRTSDKGTSDTPPALDIKLALIERKSHNVSDDRGERIA